MQRKSFYKNIPTQLKLWDKYLGGNKFLNGDDVTYVDFIANETIDFYRLLYGNILEDFSNSSGYQNRIKNLPELQDYLNSSFYKRWLSVPSYGKIWWWEVKNQAMLESLYIHNLCK
ncbi:hypothetical protein CEXT_110031 [Caerostris extrusa]|uniref:GST C-terminal domain-containing protein n=1 Tax=Caerostris extrusa TaxID=172846 RepID=A0AAV4P0I3_CAEEX|nr:hypothetical protein CEXT_110031 [Caerostris extrusa]